MLVTIQLDLTQDERLFDLAEKDDRIIALMKIYDALGGDDYLTQIGDKLWNISDYAQQIWNICEGDVYDFTQMSAWMFEFKTSENNAVLFLTGFSSPKILRVVKPKLATRNDLELKS